MRGFLNVFDAHSSQMQPGALKVYQPSILLVDAARAISTFGRHLKRIDPELRCCRADMPKAT